MWLDCFSAEIRKNIIETGFGGCLVFVLLIGVAASSSLAFGGKKMPPPRHHLKYFGYSLVDCGWDDPNDRSRKTQYLNEVHGFTNIAQLCVYSPEDWVISRVRAMNEKGIKALLAVQSIFFEEKGLDSNGIPNFDLRPDYKSRWLRFISRNRLVLKSSSILAFYLVDEPFWTGVSYQELKTVSDLVKGTYPLIPTAFIESYTAIHELKVPPSVDWIGFDHYGVYDPSADVVFQGELRLLKSRFSRKDQRVILVLEGQWLSEYSDSGFEPEIMGDIARNYYRAAQRDPSVIALIGYPWAGGLDGPGQLGTRSLPATVLRVHREIGNKILFPLNPL